MIDDEWNTDRCKFSGTLKVVGKGLFGWTAGFSGKKRKLRVSFSCCLLLDYLTFFWLLLLLLPSLVPPLPSYFVLLCNYTTVFYSFLSPTFIICSFLHQSWKIKVLFSLGLQLNSLSQKDSWRTVSAALLSCLVTDISRPISFRKTCLLRLRCSGLSELMECLTDDKMLGWGLFILL